MMFSSSRNLANKVTMSELRKIGGLKLGALFLGITLVGLAPLWVFYGHRHFVTPWHSLQATYFYALVLVIVTINIFLAWRVAQTGTEQLIHVTVLLVTINSFYALGWPADLLSLEEGVLAGHLAELSVVLVLFLLSEVAVRLNYETHTISANIGDKIEIAAMKVEEAKEQVGRAVSSLEEADLTRTLDSLSVSVGIIQSGSRFMQNLSRLSNQELQAEIMLKGNSWMKAWVDLIERADMEAGTGPVSAMHKDVPTKGDCLGVVLAEYLDAERETLSAGYLVAPRMILDSNQRTISTGSIQTPRIVAGSDMYFRILTKIATKVQRGFGDSTHQLLYWSYTNLLPREWYNWRFKDGNRQLQAMDNYRRCVSVIADLGSVSLRRTFVVTSEHNRQIEAHGLSLKKQLVDQLEELYCLSFSNSMSNSSPIQFDPLPLETARRYLISLAKHNKLATPELTVATLLQDLDWCQNPNLDPKVYPILSIDQLARLGVTVSGDNTSPIRTSDEVQVKIQSLASVFFSALGHIDGKDCSTLTADWSILEEFPDRKPDILLIGIKQLENDTRHWLIAIATALVAGDDTMAMRVITNSALLEHISRIGENHFAPLKRPD